MVVLDLGFVGRVLGRFRVEAGHDIAHDGGVLGDALQAVPADDGIRAQAGLAAVAALGTDAAQLQPLGMNHIGVAHVAGTAHVSFLR